MKKMWEDLKQVILDFHIRAKKQKELAKDNQSKIEYGCVIEGLEIARREMISIENHLKTQIFLVIIQRN